VKAKPKSNDRGSVVPTRIRVAIVDDDDGFRRSLARFIQSAGIDVATFTSAEDFLASPIQKDIDCAVIDLQMPGLSGLQLQDEINQTLPHLAVVFLTGHGEVSLSVRAMKAGAADFIEKPVAGEDLLPVLQRAMERSREQKTMLQELDDLHKRYQHLTPREREVFALVAAGLLNKQIGFDLGTGEKTVKVHRARVMEKMRAASVADLVRMADRLGVRPISKERRELASGRRSETPRKQPERN
jgi:FixJ family two-component response regulator